MRYRVIRVSNSITTYRDCDTFNDAVSALDRLQHAFRYTGIERTSVDRLRVGLSSFTIANEYRIVGQD